MADRIPLVLAGGEPQRLQSTDNLVILGLKAFGGGGVNVGGDADPGVGCLFLLNDPSPKIRFYISSAAYGGEGGQIVAAASSGAWNSAYLDFLTHPTNVATLVSAMRLGAGLNIGGTADPGAGKLSVATGYSADSGGLKHKRVSAGNVNNNSTSLIDVTWDTAFADINYTPVPCLLLATAGPGLIIAITAKTAAKVTVAISNQTGSNVTPDIHVIAIHD